MFDITVDGEPLGSISIGLFGQIVPRTVDNFVHFAEQAPGQGYKGSKFHRLIEDFMIQGIMIMIKTRLPLNAL